MDQSSGKVSQDERTHDQNPAASQRLTKAMRVNSQECGNSAEDALPQLFCRLPNIMQLKIELAKIVSVDETAAERD